MAGLGAVLLITQGLGAIRQGEVAYPNYWGGVVFPPFSVAIGVALLVLACLWPKKIQKLFTRPRDKRGRPIR